jgi:heme oxygenase
MLPVNLRDRLKLETRQQHEALEAKLDLQRADFSRDDLRRLLERFYGYYRPCEADVRKFAHAIPPALIASLAQRAKSPLLAADLTFFGHTKETIAALPVCNTFPADTAAKTLGRWYVLEGSTLGGQVLAAQFARKFGLAGKGCQFFACYGEQTISMWKDFCRLLNDYSASGSDDEAVAFANQTFKSMEAWLSTPMTSTFASAVK